METPETYLCPRILRRRFNNWAKARDTERFPKLQRNNSYVWSTSTDLADEMMATWTKHGSTKISNICEDITMPVLTLDNILELSDAVSLVGPLRYRQGGVWSRNTMG